MSTLTQEQPATGDGAPTRLLSLPLALTFLAEFGSLTSFCLLLSVMPMLAAAVGAGSGQRRAGHGLPDARHGGRGGGCGTRDPAVRLPDDARGRSGPARRPGLTLLGREPQAVMMASASCAALVSACQALAGQFVITLDTVKKHVGHVLGKLGAVNRSEAVARARELSLIP